MSTKKNETPVTNEVVSIDNVIDRLRALESAMLDFEFSRVKAGELAKYIALINHLEDSIKDLEMIQIKQKNVND